MNVHWTETAERHLDAIYAYIACESVTYALRTVDKITRRSQQIGLFPKSGRRVSEYDIDPIREVFSDEYRIIYHIQSDQINVLAVIHGAREVLREHDDDRDLTCTLE